MRRQLNKPGTSYLCAERKPDIASKTYEYSIYDLEGLEIIYDVIFAQWSLLGLEGL